MPISKTKSLYHVSLNEAKRHLRIETDYTEDDDYINALIKAASNYCENYIGKDITYTTNEYNIFDFTGDIIRIDEGNLIEVQSVISDASVSLDIGVTKKFYNYFEIELTDTVSYTSDYTPLTVNFTTGYNENECPAEIVQAIYIKITDLYDEERSDYVWSGKPKTNVVETLLNSHKLILFG